MRHEADGDGSPSARRVRGAGRSYRGRREGVLPWRERQAVGALGADEALHEKGIGTQAEIQSGEILRRAGVFSTEKHLSSKFYKGSG